MVGAGGSVDEKVDSYEEDEKQRSIGDDGDEGVEGGGGGMGVIGEGR